MLAIRVTQIWPPVVITVTTFADVIYRCHHYHKIYSLERVTESPNLEEMSREVGVGNVVGNQATASRFIAPPNGPLQNATLL